MGVSPVQLGSSVEMGDEGSGALQASERRGQRAGTEADLVSITRSGGFSTGVAFTNAFPSKARQITFLTASTTDGRGVGGSEPGINHCEGTWAARWYADIGRGEKRFDFERGKSFWKNVNRWK